MKKQQGGFTLIELIMVIVILGILAAVALPRFVNLGGDARAASISGALGSVRSASAIVHSAALARNQTGPTGTVATDGGNVATVNGYIAGTTAAIRTAAQLDAADYTVADNNAGVVTVTLGSCSFTYAQAANANTAPVISAIGGRDANGGC